ncbi:hypothetical protein SUBVAR_07303 [Subdoligranulum variabile DSM 15176]|uniref:Uncharacterized protein n=1 Tax=Subdoligranulum variabile DSM 15176 TaxID=411471 RepID=D1PSC0_9FIRM|nr:hypothetical protein SUBVAR_07303 [Subdoligranulum variabile DSM 15176]
MFVCENNNILTPGKSTTWGILAAFFGRVLNFFRILWAVWRSRQPIDRVFPCVLAVRRAVPRCVDPFHTAFLANPRSGV